MAESLPMEDADWRSFCESAQAEISADIDAALMRVAAGNSTWNDARLLAGYLNRGHLFDSYTDGPICRQPEDEE